MDSESSEVRAYGLEDGNANGDELPEFGSTSREKHFVPLRGGYSVIVDSALRDWPASGLSEDGVQETRTTLLTNVDEFLDRVRSLDARSVIRQWQELVERAVREGFGTNGKNGNGRDGDSNGHAS
jgi:hypothetical protein